jgi:hypothetical protein
MKAPMKKKKRVRRSTPERTQPIRSWSGLFGATQGAPPGPTDQQINDDVASPASRGVRLGYQVAEEHLRDNGAARGGWPDFSGADPQKMAGRLLQYAADLSSGWLDLLGALMMNGGMVPPSPGRSPGPFVATRDSDDAPLGSEAPVAVEIKLRLKSNKPVEVSASIEPSSRGGALVVHDLRMADNHRSRIAGATVEWSGDALVVSLEIGAQQAPGHYEGTVVEEATSVRRGTVKVTVSR